MAQTEQRELIRKNIRFTGNKHLIFEQTDGVWKIAFYRARKPEELRNEVDPEIHRRMTKAGMLEQKPRNYWYRVALQHESLDTGIYSVLETAGMRHLYRDIKDYIEATTWGRYLFPE